MRLFVCSGPLHFLLDEKGPHRNIQDRSRPADAKAPAAGAAAPAVPFQVVEGVPRLQWDVVVDVELAGVDQQAGDPNVVIPAGTPLDRIFHFKGTPEEEKRQLRGTFRELPRFRKYREGVPPSHRFYVRVPGTNTFDLIGELSQPGDETKYRRPYYVSLDQNGNLRVHAGEVPFWETRVAADLKKADSKGRVFVTELNPPDAEVDTQLDPFSGVH
jgi:hypothetical protein